MIDINDSSAIVTPRHIRKALNKGNIDGVRRLARFVGSSRPFSEYDVFEHCQQQRFLGLYVQRS